MGGVRLPVGEFSAVIRQEGAIFGFINLSLTEQGLEVLNLLFELENAALAGLGMIHALLLVSGIAVLLRQFDHQCQCFFIDHQALDELAEIFFQQFARHGTILTTTVDTRFVTVDSPIFAPCTCQVGSQAGVVFPLHLLLTMSAARDMAKGIGIGCRFLATIQC